MFARIGVMRSKKAAAGLRKSATAPHMGMIRSPQLMWPCVVNKRLQPLIEARRDLDSVRRLVARVNISRPSKNCLSGRRQRVKPRHCRICQSLGPPPVACVAACDRVLEGGRIKRLSAGPGVNRTWNTMRPFIRRIMAARPRAACKVSTRCVTDRRSRVRYRAHCRSETAARHRRHSHYIDWRQNHAVGMAVGCHSWRYFRNQRECPNGD